MRVRVPHRFERASSYDIALAIFRFFQGLWRTPPWRGFIMPEFSNQSRISSRIPVNIREYSRFGIRD